MAANKIIFILFLLIPFQFSLGSIEGSDMALIRLVIPALFLGWLGRSLYVKEISLPTPVTFFAFTSFLLWVACSLLWAENPDWAIPKVVFWFNFFPVFLVLIFVFQNKSLRESALKGLIWGAAAIGLVGIIEFLAQFIIPVSVLTPLIFQSLIIFLGENFARAVSAYPSIFVNIGGATLLRAFGFFPDPHIFAYYTGMLIPLAGYVALKPHATIIQKSLPWILLLATLLSFSRASYVALLAALGIFLGVTLIQSRKTLPAFTVLVAVTLTIAIIMSPVATRFTSSFSSQDGSVNERNRLWKEAASHIGHFPLTGVGIGNYPLAVKPSASPREPIYVHNLYLDIAVELGLIGLGLFLFFVFSCLPKFSFSKDTILSYRLALFLSLSIFLTHSFFEYPLFSVHVLPLLLSILAFLYEEKKHA